MTTHRRLIAGAAGLAILLAACGGTAASPAATTEPTTAAPTEAPATAEASEAPASVAPSEEASGAGGLPGGIGGMNALAELLPEEANGIRFQRAGFTGEQLSLYGAAAGFSESDLADVLAQFNKTMDDMNMAVAGSADGSTPATILAMQVEGVPAADWMQAGNMNAGGGAPVTVGGKQVFTAGAGAFNVWMYPTGDTLFMVILGDEALAEAVFSQLP